MFSLLWPFVYISISLIFIFLIIRFLDYPDYLPRSGWVRIIEVQLYFQIIGNLTYVLFHIFPKPRAWHWGHICKLPLTWMLWCIWLLTHYQDPSIPLYYLVLSANYEAKTESTASLNFTAILWAKLTMCSSRKKSIIPTKGIFYNTPPPWIANPFCRGRGRGRPKILFKCLITAHLSRTQELWRWSTNVPLMDSLGNHW